MSIFKLTPDKAVKFQIDDSGFIDFDYGNKIYRTRTLVAENAILNRSNLEKIEILDDSREAYILEFHPHDSVIAVVFEKDDWKKQRNGSYFRQIKNMYCDDNGLKTICDYKGITLKRGGLLTPSYQISNEQEALKEFNSADNVMDVLICLENINFIDFLIKYKKNFKKKGFFEQGLLLSLASANLLITSKYYSTDVFLQLLKEADKEKLRGCGDLFESNGEIIAYRGIPNKKENFRIHKIFWTLDSGIAAWFAKEYRRNGRNPDDIPAVYKVTVPHKAIFFYNNERNEQEIVIDPEICENMEELLIFPKSVNPNLLDIKVVNL